MRIGDGQFYNKVAANIFVRYGDVGPDFQEIIPKYFLQNLIQDLNAQGREVEASGYISSAMVGPPELLGATSYEKVEVFLPDDATQSFVQMTEVDESKDTKHQLLDEGDAITSWNEAWESDSCEQLPADYPILSGHIQSLTDEGDFRQRTIIPGLGLQGFGTIPPIEWIAPPADLRRWGIEGGHNGIYYIFPVEHGQYMLQPYLTVAMIRFLTRKDKDREPKRQLIITPWVFRGWFYVGSLKLGRYFDHFLELREGEMLFRRCKCVKSYEQSPDMFLCLLHGGVVQIDGRTFSFYLDDIKTDIYVTFYHRPELTVGMAFQSERNEMPKVSLNGEIWWKRKDVGHPPNAPNGFPLLLGFNCQPIAFSRLCAEPGLRLLQGGALRTIWYTWGVSRSIDSGLTWDVLCALRLFCPERAIESLILWFLLYYEREYPVIFESAQNYPKRIYAITGFDVADVGLLQNI